jgi:aspartate/methionine/tyrosine aminotransferase
MPADIPSQTPFTALRPEVRDLPASGIVRVFNYGRGRPGLIPLWAGEGDSPTPDFICAAASASLAAGETFYTNNRGIPDLRQALAQFTQRLYGVAAEPEEFIVTAGGMSAIQLATQAIAGPGAELVVPAPAWPNFAGAAGIHGARVVEVPLDFGQAGWTLDLDRFFAAVTPATRALVINSPANPTGWTASDDDLEAILAFARRRGLWIIADEIYGRFYWKGSLAPSFQQLRRADDRIVFVNTFSKNWAMTGWRIGWLQAPVALAPVFENLVQYNTSGVATFMQRAGIAALNDGEDFAQSQIARARRGRDVVGAALASVPGLDARPPDGAFYAFLRLPGVDDTMQAALDIVDEANVGLAPGTAFGPHGAGFIRICVLRSQEGLEDGMRRLAHWLTTRRQAALKT